MKKNGQIWMTIKLSIGTDYNKKKNSNDNTGIVDVSSLFMANVVYQYARIHRLLSSFRDIIIGTIINISTSPNTEWSELFFVVSHYISEKRAFAASLQLLKILLLTYVYFYTANNRSMPVLSVSFSIFR